MKKLFFLPGLLSILLVTGIKAQSPVDVTNYAECEYWAAPIVASTANCSTTPNLLTDEALFINDDQNPVEFAPSNFEGHTSDFIVGFALYNSSTIISANEIARISIQQNNCTQATDDDLSEDCDMHTIIMEYVSDDVEINEM